MDRVIISDKQAVDFLGLIWGDMVAYIREHQEEYQKFLESEGLTDDPDFRSQDYGSLNKESIGLLLRKIYQYLVRLQLLAS